MPGPAMMDKFSRIWFFLSIYVSSFSRSWRLKKTTYESNFQDKTQYSLDAHNVFFF